MGHLVRKAAYLHKASYGTGVPATMSHSWRCFGRPWVVIVTEFTQAGPFLLTFMFQLLASLCAQSAFGTPGAQLLPGSYISHRWQSLPTLSLLSRTPPAPFTARSLGAAQMSLFSTIEDFLLNCHLSIAFWASNMIPVGLKNLCVFLCGD